MSMSDSLPIGGYPWHKARSVAKYLASDPTMPVEVSWEWNRPGAEYLVSAILFLVCGVSGMRLDLG